MRFRLAMAAFVLVTAVASVAGLAAWSSLTVNDAPPEPRLELLAQQTWPAPLPLLETQPADPAMVSWRMVLVPVEEPGDRVVVTGMVEATTAMHSH